MKLETLRRAYLREATCALIASRLAIQLLPASYVFAWASRRPKRRNRFATDEIDWITWAIEAIGSKPWMNAASLARALAAQGMLRRRGIVSNLCLGVALDRDELKTHAWIEHDQQVILGGVDAAHFTRLAAFGGGDA
jgi:hypothetical protein